ncbi:hypothetical protein APX70_05395 [Pseudomonas syringae pv. maculicola]|uniref:Uncharacterized protein n=1 Tax=Pseudomonas syringae pv. maculicola TaxID=59511 RepID=A0A3M2XGJ1_PSEYM|nr:hypothetical protein APX70_05395 [Pseudomonas syringae pv. maculicola]
MRHENDTGMSPRMARVIALMPGLPTQRTCSSGDGLSLPAWKL